MIATGLPKYQGLITDVEWGGIEITPPFLTYDDHVTLYAMMCAATSAMWRPAHTSNDSIVWLPERAVLFAGDLVFNGGTPFMLMGSITGAIDVLDNVVRPLASDHRARTRRGVRPGRHRGRAGVPAVRPGRGAPRQGGGLSPLEAARDTDLGQYQASATRAHRRQPAPRLRRPGRRQGEVSIPAALMDMVAYNGGKPLTCLA